MNPKQELIRLRAVPLEDPVPCPLAKAEHARIFTAFRDWCVRSGYWTLTREIDQEYSRSVFTNVSTYFIRHPMGPIKIGVTRDLKARLADLQCGNPYPLFVRAALVGDCEARLHRIFRSFKLSGEWFKSNNPLDAFVSLVVDANARAAGSSVA